MIYHTTLFFPCYQFHIQIHVALSTNEKKSSYHSLQHTAIIYFITHDNKRKCLCNVENESEKQF